MLETLTKINDAVNSFVWTKTGVWLLIATGILMTVLTRGFQFSHFRHWWRKTIGSLLDKNVISHTDDKATISQFQALCTALAATVGVGNIAGVSAAIITGGPGAVFWMWFAAVFGMMTNYSENVLGIYFRRKNHADEWSGGAMYYLQDGLGGYPHMKIAGRVLAVIFAVCAALASFGIGNMGQVNKIVINFTSSFDIKALSSHVLYTSGGKDITLYMLIVGIVLMVLVGFVVIGGLQRIAIVAEKIVPFMGIAYVLISLIVIGFNVKNVPHMFALIFRDAFDFRSIFGGLAGSCMVLGIKRGLYSNEACVGSAPNASASAHVSHPVKQGLVQTVSVYIDTILLCTATAFMCLSSGTPYNEEVSGAMYVQNSISTVFGKAGPVFITAAMVLFAFTTLLGNLYYVDNALIYLNKKRQPSKRFMTIFYIVCVIVIFAGALMEMGFAWTLADITMGGMALINIPCCLMLSKQAIAALRDYEKQKKAGKDPEFRAADIGLDAETLSFWK